MKKINEQIRHYRVINKLSQESVAEELGIKQQAYALYEKANADISISKLYKLADIYNISIVQLLGEDKQEIDYNDCPNCKRYIKTIDSLQEYIDTLKTQIDFIKNTYNSQKERASTYGTDIVPAMDFM
jgi:transcriptional regulator with XRE-family HTH domain